MFDTTGGVTLVASFVIVVFIAGTDGHCLYFILEAVAYCGYALPEAVTAGGGMRSGDEVFAIKERSTAEGTVLNRAVQ